MWFNYVPDFKSLRDNREFRWHLSTLVAYIRLNLFVKIDLQLWLAKPFDEPSGNDKILVAQGVLF